MKDNIKISVTNLNKTFNKKNQLLTALDSVSFDIQDGEFVCLVGPSGCGKTTLLRILAGLDKQTSGDFRLHKQTDHQPLQSMIFQEKGVIPWLTVEENVAFGLTVRHAPKSLIKERTTYFLKKTGLENYRTIYPSHLSGGMKQRVSIARAFANDPEILLMDEPFAALDEQNKFILQEELLSMWEETKKTVLFITHSIDEALLLSDRIFLMSGQPGRIIEEKRINMSRPRSIKEARANPEMSRLFLEIWDHLQSEVQADRKD